MDGTGVVIVVIVVIVVFLIIMGASSGSRDSRTATITPPPRPVAPTPRMVVRARRPGRSNTDPVTTIPIDMTDPIRIPLEVRVFHNQKTCRVCQQSILWSSRNVGWVRCMATNKLVHKDCYDYVYRGHSGVRNWCTICNGSCTSGQAMRTERG